MVAALSKLPSREVKQRGHETAPENRIPAIFWRWLLMLAFPSTLPIVWTFHRQMTGASFPC